MSKHNQPGMKLRAPTLMPPIGGPVEMPAKSTAVESLTIRIDRQTIGAQDKTIEEMSGNGYLFAESFSLNGGEIAMRFIRAAQ